ncbi:MAG: hypothetical protein KDE27_19890 [Planctomycetes bacterium]|nr:hypothetical protein [Planctomycetota bacterium]
MRILLSSVLLLATATGQSYGLEIAGFENPVGTPEWGDEIDNEAEHAALRYDAPAGAYTLFVAHTTIDDSPAGQAAAPGMFEAYPFLQGRSPSWTNTHAAFGPGGSDYVWQGPNTELHVPPERVAAHLAAFAAAPAAQRGEFGTWNATAGLRVHSAPLWPAGLPTPDERYSWSGSWLDGWWQTPNIARAVFDPRSVGRRSLTAAAEIATAIGDGNGIDDLFFYVEREYGFILNVQPIHVWPDNPGKPKIAIGQAIHIRLRSLNSEEPVWQILGACRAVPDIWVPGRFFHLVGRDEWLLVHVDYPVTPENHKDLVAMVPTASGWVSVPQAETPEGIAPMVARFHYPADGIGGLIWVFSLSKNDVIHPLYEYDNTGAMLVFPFTLDS